VAPILAEPAALEEGCHLNRSSHSPRCWPARDPRCLRYGVESSEINPRLLDRCGIGIDIAEQLLVTAGDDPGRMRSKAHRSLLQKSDRRDALELCEGLSRGFYRSVVHVLQHRDCDDRHKLGSQDAPRPAQE
jgi:hypothetical protein